MILDVRNTVTFFQRLRSRFLLFLFFLNFFIGCHFNQSINQSINLYRAIVQRRVLQCGYAESKRNLLRRILNVLTDGAVRQFSGREFQSLDDFQRVIVTVFICCALTAVYCWISSVHNVLVRFSVGHREAAPTAKLNQCLQGACVAGGRETPPPPHLNDPALPWRGVRQSVRAECCTGRSRARCAQVLIEYTWRASDIVSSWQLHAGTSLEPRPLVNVRPSVAALADWLTDWHCQSQPDRMFWHCQLLATEFPQLTHE